VTTKTGLQAAISGALDAVLAGQLPEVRRYPRAWPLFVASCRGRGLQPEADLFVDLVRTFEARRALTASVRAADRAETARIRVALDRRVAAADRALTAALDRRAGAALERRQRFVRQGPIRMW
jgi:hypothetical protein